MSYDIVLANIPKSKHTIPYLGTFILKSVIQNNGFTCKTFDWNRDLYEKSERRDELFNRGNLYFNRQENFEELWNTELKDICSEWIEELKKCNPKWFGFTFMSQRNLHVGKRILETVRVELPDVKIVVGGFLVGYFNGRLGFELIRKGLIDYFVNGEGEEAIINVLNGNYDFPGINSKTPASPIKLDTIPCPDYSDVANHGYTLCNTFNSRGCVNHCGFCTENTFARRYRFRKAEFVIRDIEASIKTLGVKSFLFTDSLINGNPKEFRNLSKILIGKGVKWRGYFLCNSWMTQEDYMIAAESGLCELMIGVESGSERVRKDMGKGFSDESLNNAIAYSVEAGIRSHLLFIIGFPTETEEDFIKSMDFITKVSKQKNVEDISINPGMTCLLGKELESITSQYDIDFGVQGKWVYKDNNYEVRKNRWIRFVDHCKSLNLSVMEDHRSRVEETYDNIC
ncbi:MAG: B12-binding domain-containing radical SAM protein [Candidatus Heimdallarchaeaceae archaeon]